ncbi:hypothetical protein ACFWBI_08955 [Streptomyces sp. NPDC059982]|uniref:hypothetical protein n=1 Tax=unclassified Streptomyces TaxID=2593676 RepID=UPI0036C23CF2
MIEQPVRHTADTITDDDLDQLYAELERYRLAWSSARSRAGGARIAWRCWFRLAEKRRIRAEQAEAALARVRAVAEELIKHGCPWSGDSPGAGRAILAALNEPKGTRP